LTGIIHVSNKKSVFYQNFNEVTLFCPKQVDTDFLKVFRFGYSDTGTKPAKLEPTRRNLEPC